VLRRAVELGVNHIDTAAFYFSPLRSANELINTALAPYSDGLVIATKVGPGRDPQGAWQGMARPDQLRGQVEENLRQLGRDHLDLVNLRALSLSKPVGEHFAALAALRDAWLVRHLSLGGREEVHLVSRSQAGLRPVKKSRKGAMLGLRSASMRPLRSAVICWSWMRCVGIRSGPPL